MNTTINQNCTRCLASIPAMIANHSLDLELLSESIEESISMQKAHYSIMESQMSFEEKVRHKTKEFQMQILLGILLRADLRSK